MAEKNDGGDKTEKPTAKRLRDSRKKGDVPKSRELTSTVGLAVWLALGAGVLGHAADRLAALTDQMLGQIARGWPADGFASLAASQAWLAAELVIWLAAVLVLPVAAVGLLTEYLQVGPVMALEKVTPKLDHLNPASGVKRMFSMDNLIELAKNIGKTVLLVLVGWLVVRSLMPQIVGQVLSAEAPAQAMGALIWQATVKTMAWAIALFVGVALLDAVYQRFSFTKKLRMSLRDIRQELKDDEGDPLVKQQRKQAHAEWSQRNAAGAARTANALVVNPTHVAIAIDYDRETCPVPTIAAKGEDHVARAMREAAEEAGVPIVRNVALARDMLARAEVGEIVPPDLFDIVAEVVLWAREVRTQLAHEEAVAQATANGAAPPGEAPRRRAQAPGEDLTRYAGSPTHPND